MKQLLEAATRAGRPMGRPLSDNAKAVLAYCHEPRYMKDILARFDHAPWVNYTVHNLSSRGHLVNYRAGISRNAPGLFCTTPKKAVLPIERYWGSLRPPAELRETA